MADKKNTPNEKETYERTPAGKDSNYENKPTLVYVSRGDKFGKSHMNTISKKINLNILHVEDIKGIEELKKGKEYLFLVDHDGDYDTKEMLKHVANNYGEKSIYTIHAAKHDLTGYDRKKVKPADDDGMMTADHLKDILADYAENMHKSEKPTRNMYSRPQFKKVA